jgi:thiamine transport system substrate-binding protein
MSPERRGPRPIVPPVVAAGVGLLLAACSAGSGAVGAGSTADAGITAAPPASFPPTTITLVTHDSFAVSKDVLAAFTARTGITVKIDTGGDAGVVVNKAVLTAGNPEGDVLFGVDNTLLSRAVDAGVFAPYRPAALAGVAPQLRTLVTGDAVVPIDYGDVCVNIDQRWFASHGVPEPTTLAQLADPAYKDLLVVENPATSSPGLAFLLATVARYGDPGWQDYWKSLRSNGVKVVDSWTDAYDAEYSAGGGKGQRPLVVSYGTSPPAEIVYASDPKPAQPYSAVMTDGCFRQVEFAGVLAGTQHVQEARAFVDFLLSPQFQADEPLQMYVYPSVTGTPLPAIFTKWSVRSTDSLSVPPADITAHRTAWVDQWTQVVLR